MVTEAKTWLQKARLRLQEAGIDNPALEARLLLCHAAGWTPEALIAHPEREVPADVQARLEEALRRRTAREPLAYITGEKEFWGRSFMLNRHTLIPRPESETLIELCLALHPEPPQAVLDFGTGSGCLLLTLLAEWPQARGVGVDIAPEALTCATANARALGLDKRAEFMLSDWGDDLPRAAYGLIISNPPYIAEGDMPTLQPEVRDYEPRRALTAGKDGLEAYRKLAETVTLYLTESGFVVLEAGAGQARDVTNIFHKQGLSRVATRNDLLGFERALAFSRRPHHQPS